MLNEVTSLKATSPKTKTMKVTWKKDSSVTGYQIQYSTNSKFSKASQKTIGRKDSYTLTNLSSKKTYYIRLRSYQKIGDNLIYGKWTSAVKIKTK